MHNHNCIIINQMISSTLLHLNRRRFRCCGALTFLPAVFAISSPTTFRQPPNTDFLTARLRAVDADVSHETGVGLLQGHARGKLLPDFLCFSHFWRDDTHATSFPIRFDHEESCAVRLPFAGRLLLASTVV